MTARPPSSPSSWPIPPLRFEVDLGGDDDDEGETVRVELTCPEDIDATLRNRECDEGTLRPLLEDCWDEHVRFVREQREQILGEAGVYQGPVPCSIGRHEASVAARIPTSLDDGLVLEVSDSTVAGGGRGVFVRAAGDEDVWQAKGSAFCGYAGGGFAAGLEGLSGNQRRRTFEFRLDDGIESTLWFRGNLQSIAEVVRQTEATRLAGHELVFDDGGSLVDVQPMEDHPHAFRYFVPIQQQSAENITIQALGQMINDLAGGYDVQGEEDYNESSQYKNVLVLVPQLHLKVSEDDNENARRILQPSGGPIVTLCHTIRIPNSNEPMEVGCQYGYYYWSNKDG